MPLAAVGLSNQDLGVSSPNPHIEVAIKTNEEMMYIPSSEHLTERAVRSLKNANLIHGIWNWIHGLVSLVKLFGLHFFFESHSPNTKAKTILIGEAHNILLRERDTQGDFRMNVFFAQKFFLHDNFITRLHLHCKLPANGTTTTKNEIKRSYNRSWKEVQ